MNSYMLCFLFLAVVNKEVHSHGKLPIVQVCAANTKYHK